MMFIDQQLAKMFWYKHANLFMRMTKSCLRWRLESLERLEYGCPFPPPSRWKSIYLDVAETKR